MDSRARWSRLAIIGIATVTLTGCATAAPSPASFVFVSRAPTDPADGAATAAVAPVTAGARSYRWSGARPLRLWVEPHSTLEGWTPRHLALVDEAVRAWTKAPDVRVDYVRRAYEADIQIHWSRELPATNPGLTLLYRSRLDRLRRADVYVNVVPPCWSTGTPDRVLFAIIAHELGHALGLGHDRASDALMNAAPLATQVTDEDLARLAAVVRGG